MTKQNHHLGRMRAFVLIAAVAAAAAISGSSSQADVVVFQENFNTDSANWKTTSGGADATWVAAGGADGGGYINRAFPTGGVTGVILRAQENFNSSGNGFQRDWIASGVDHFSIALKTDSATPLELSFRFAASPFPGAATNNITLAASNSWTTISIPIIDSLGAGGVFQTYEGAKFEDVFGSLARIQLTISNAASLTNPFNLSVDSATISAVPEPASMTVLGLAIGGAAFRRWRIRKNAANEKSVA